MYLHHEFYSPEDVLVWQGEISKGMWFVASGSLEVIRASPEEGVPDVVVANLTDGTYFGEIALLSQVYGQSHDQLSSKASATVRSTTFCDLYFLSISNFEQVLVQYPDIVTKMLHVAEKRRQSLNMKINVHRKSFSQRGAFNSKQAPEVIEKLTSLNLNQTKSTRGRTMSSDDIDDDSTRECSVGYSNTEQFDILKAQHAETLEEVRLLKAQVEKLVRNMS